MKKRSLRNDGAGAARLLVLLALLAVVAAGSYWKIPAAREAVDTHLPVVKETLARFGAAPPAEDGAESPPASGDQAASPGSAGPAPLTVAALAADPTSWPKTVHLKKSVEFPAVVGGKEVGKALVKTGTEVRLVRIQNGSLGLEYQGGGAWVKPDDTDVLERARPPAPKAAPAVPSPL